MPTSQASSSLAATLARNVKQARRDAGLSQRKLAEKLDTDPSLVSKWERGVHRPEDTTLLAVGDLTGRDFPWFFTDHSGECA